MTGPSVDIFKQTIVGYDIAALLRLMTKANRPEGEEILKRVWSAFALLNRQNAAAYVPPTDNDGAYLGVDAARERLLPKSGALPEICHTDKIEVKSISDEFAEVSETTWQKLKTELFGAGLDAEDVRLIARSLAKGETAGHGGGASPRYEYRKVQPNG